MAQYIDKDALVAEIGEAIDGSAPSHDQQCSWEDGYYCGLYKVKSIIDNLEVKEVDLAKEIDEVIHNYKLNNHRHTSICAPDIEWIAKHFFELGLKAYKGK